ncbi:LysR family transcriptional regulator [Rhizobiaceae bacterium]|nr:LysR family transcriptional regulator [Rhizobiaceae bacterium]
MKIERRNDLSLRLLEIFGAVMDRRTMVGAAEHLGISQPAVSNAIKTLEKQVGFALFQRVSRSIVPTDEAHLLLAEIEPAFAVLRNVETEIRDLRGLRSGRLKLAATPPIGHTLVPIALRKFMAHRPKLTVQLSVRRLETVLQSVETGSADIGLILGLPGRDQLRSRVLAQEPMVCVVPVGHRLAGKESVTPGDLVGEDMIGLETSLGATVESTFAQAGVTYTPRIVVRYCHSACILVDAGVGVSVVDPFTARFSRGLDLAVRPFAPSCAAVAVAVTRRSNTPSKLQAAFLDLLDAVVSES